MKNHPDLKAFPDWLPESVKEYYKDVGISGLFAWQDEIVSKTRSLKKNVVFSAPTSAGKSIVAELLALQVAKSGKKVLLTLPYISIAREKLHQLQRCWRKVDLTVSGFIGPQSVNPSEWTGAVCTIEKAANLVNRALCEGWFEDIGLIVVDELHMLFDSSRGPTIEYLLAKCLFMNRVHGSKVRVIGMSATIQQLPQVAEWLSADMFQVDFRPVELRQMFSDCENIYELETNGKGKLCRQVVPNSDPVLRLKISIDLAKRMDPLLTKERALKELIERNKTGLIDIKEKLDKLGCNDKMLYLSLARGIAFHHAGMTVEERECIEDGFRNNFIMVIVATSTLASGVNLPAARVVIKAQTRGPSALTGVSYRQMVGRAGRLGFTSSGESFLVARKSDQKQVLDILYQVTTGSSKPRFMDVPKFLLEAISTGLVTSEAQVVQLSKCLLDNCDQNILTPAIQKLEDNSFVCKVVTEDEWDPIVELRPTQLGRATLASSLPPDAALFIFDDLSNAAKSVALDTELHLLYLVTPVNVSVWHECDWNHLFTLFNGLNAEQKRVAKLVGASERFLMEKLQGRQQATNEKKLQVHIRFFSALALHELINEGTLLNVSTKFRITRGCLQTLQNQSATYASMVVAFCSRLGWLYLKALLEGFALRLQFGIRSELSELVSIDGIDGHRARALHEKGFTCISQIVTAQHVNLCQCLQYAVPYSRNMVNDGKAEWLAGEPRMCLDEAAKVLKERAKSHFVARIRDLGVNINLQSVEEQLTFEPKAEVDKENLSPDSGLGGSEVSTLETSTLKPSVEDILTECSKSMIEMSLVEEEDDIFATQPVLGTENDVQDHVDTLETTLMMMPAPVKKELYVQLSQKYQASIISEVSFSKPSSSFPEDSFECSLVVVKKEEDKNRRTSLVTRFIEKESKRRSSIGLNTSTASSCNSSFDIFSTTTAPNRTSIKHKRISCVPCSPSASAIASPVQKISKKERWSFAIEDVCRSRSSFNMWLEKSRDFTECGLEPVMTNDETIIGVAVSTPSTSVYLPISDDMLPAKAKLEKLSRKDSSINEEEIETAIRAVAKKCRVFLLKMDDVFHLYQQLGVRFNDVVVVEMLSGCMKMDQTQVELELRDVLGQDSASFLGEAAPFRTMARTHGLKALSDKLQVMAERQSSKQSVKLELSTATVVAGIFYNGLPFDSIRCAKGMAELRKKLSTIEDECWKMAGQMFNIESSQQVASVLFAKLRLVHPGGGNAASKRHLLTNKAILEKIKVQHPIVDLILSYRHINHTLSHCLLPLSTHETREDGRMRCFFNLCTATGRMLAHRPNLQNVPKNESTDGFCVRQLFKASPGNVLIGADYSQLELRVLAHVSNDQYLLKLFKSDRDIFADLSDEWKFSRANVKQLCYGLIYGMGPKSLAELTNLEQSKAEQLWKSFFKTFPQVQSYINETKANAFKNGYVETLLGRKHSTSRSCVLEEKAREERIVVNYTIQGTASEIFKNALVEIDRRIKGTSAKLVMTIHDEVLLEVKREEADKVAEIVRKSMQSSLAHLLRVPLKVSLNIGDSWNLLK